MGEKGVCEGKWGPKELADEVNKRLKFVHGGEDEDPDDLICQACGHKCRVP